MNHSVGSVARAKARNPPNIRAVLPRSNPEREAASRVFRECCAVQGTTSSALFGKALAGKASNQQPPAIRLGDKERRGLGSRWGI